jgi:glycerophosphoryl diester phosphodiesterase
MTLKQIKKLKTSNNFEIPTLNEVLNLLDKKLVVNIEMKSENISQEIASKIEEYVKKYNWNYEQFIVSSFNHPSLLDFRKLLPEVKIGVLIGHLPVNTSFLLDYAPYCVSLNSEFISKDFVNSVHSKGIKVFVYTVNTQFELDKLKKIDIDGVFSDFPDKID